MPLRNGKKVPQIDPGSQRGPGIGGALGGSMNAHGSRRPCGKGFGAQGRALSAPPARLRCPLKWGWTDVLVVYGCSGTQ